VLAAWQYIGKLGHAANGVVSVTSHWADGGLHVPLGVRPCRPASRLPKGEGRPGLRHQAGAGLGTDRRSSRRRGALPGRGRRLRLRREPQAGKTAARRYLRSLHPAETRIAIICDNYSPHLSTKKDTRVGDWAAANNVEIAYTPTNSSWLNRIEAQFTALRYFALDGTDHPSHKAQASMIRRYIIWRNQHAAGLGLRRIVEKASAA
jgi:transposase